MILEKILAILIPCIIGTILTAMAQVKLVKKTHVIYKANDDEYPFIVKKRSLIEGLMVVLLGLAFTHVHFLYLGKLPLHIILEIEALYLIATVIYYYLVTDVIVKYLSEQSK